MKKKLIYSLIFTVIIEAAVFPQAKIGGTSKLGGSSKIAASNVCTSFPCATLVDDFNRADETPITGWTDTWEVGSVGFSISSNTARTSSNSNGTVYKTTTNYGPNLDVFTKMTAFDSGGYQQLAFRLVSEGTSGVDGYIVNAASGQLELYRVDNGSFNIVAACTVSQTLTNGDSFGARANGSAIAIYYKVAAGSWNQISSCTDATHSGAGKIGFRAGGQSSTFDEVWAGSL